MCESVEDFKIVSSCPNLFPNNISTESSVTHAAKSDDLLMFFYFLGLW